MTVPAGPAPTPTRKKRRPLRYLVLFVVAVAALFTLYTLFALNWSYSEGERAGILQKFSKRGWICKTWEGELAMTTVPGVAPVLWSFTVRDESVARDISNGLGQRVVVHYTEHKGIPSECFGDTPYFVDSVRVQGASQIP